MSIPKELKLSTQNKVLGCLHKIFKVAKKRGDIKAIPDFPAIKPREPQKRWLDANTQEVIFSHIPNRHKPIFTFMFHQGVRPGEARALQWEDVDMVNRAVIIRRTYSGTVYQDDCTKTKHSRPLPFDDHVYEMLKSLHVKGVKGFVFRQERTGKPYSTPETLNYIWDRAVKKSGAMKITLYEGTRHSFASQACNNGVGLFELQKFMGHTDPKTTERYAHLNMDGLQRVLKAKEGKVVKLDKKRKKNG